MRGVQIRVRRTDDCKAAGCAIRLDWWPQTVMDGGRAVLNHRNTALCAADLCLQPLAVKDLVQLASVLQPLAHVLEFGLLKAANTS